MFWVGLVEKWKTLFWSSADADPNTCPTFVFGNKIDLVGEKIEENIKMARGLFDGNCTGHFLVSAKSCENVEAAFQAVARKVEESDAFHTNGDSKMVIVKNEEERQTECC
eukprot:TRINITY_DN4649_c0_g1_i9.p1 TRINITY_DN4649_c0_g1~~TRINITY_DN4649_c0_g1_i9.p1  ORF type:complete len:110 (-),score=25.46 TRINITY_DN4649_c0_g1_i9:296-625(-)